MAPRGERSRRMGQRLLRELRDVGVAEEAARPVAEGYELAMDHRVLRIPDEEHPGHLHPGRTALILLRDAGERDPRTLAAAATLDTWWVDAEPPRHEVARRLGAPVAELRDAVPRPRPPEGDVPTRPGEADPDRLAEALVLAEGAVRRIALAERLDHLRHLHLLGAGDGASAARLHAEHSLAWEVYVPLAVRTDATLERRLRFWCRVFPRYLREWNPSGGAG